jgi:RNA polymerase sigma-70 factor (ECF subfamily)
MEQPAAAVIGTSSTPVTLLVTEIPSRPEPAVLEQIMRLCNQRLYRLAFGILGDASEAEDVLQESYLQAFLNFSLFRGQSGLDTWLASIVRNRAIDSLRARRMRRAACTLEADLPGADDADCSPLEHLVAPASGSQPESEVERDEVRMALEEAIALLPDVFRAVFMLREVEGLSLQQTAAYLGIPVATVKTRDHRARLLLRAALGDDFAGDPSAAFEFLRERCDRIVAYVLGRLALL